MIRLNVLIACECSGVVRNAFTKLGHNAWSCDLQPSETEGNHYQHDVRWALYRQVWHLLIAHPPCTNLAVSGARWFKEKGTNAQEEALNLVKEFLDFPIKHIAVENPVSIISSRIRKPDQIIQPYQFGHGECKKTCLWIKGLKPLIPSHNVSGREQRVHLLPQSKNRAKERSRTLPGIAEAMAQQWGNEYLLDPTWL